ncbi:MAG: translation elongation factor-like protein [Deltaproteobacteria bacterium]
MREERVGTISHYYSHLGVAALKLDSALKVGDTIHIKGHTSDFTQTIDAMEKEHKSVVEAKMGDSIGIKVSGHGREHDAVYRVLKD